MKSDENKINRPKNKTTGAVLGLRTAPVCGIRAGSRNSRRKRFKKKLRFCGVESLGKFLVLSGGVGVLAGLPVDVLEVAGAEHGVDLGVLVDVGQAPADIVVAGDGQRVVDHVGLGLCESLIAGVGVVHDGVGCVDQVGELFELVYQLLLVIGGLLRHQLDVGVVDGVVGVGGSPAPQS